MFCGVMNLLVQMLERNFGFFHGRSLSSAAGGSRRTRSRSRCVP
ncbi:MAG: hypothetical protein QOJ45_43 [Verrucomicrobiota bacterium]|jgi:hypothetical protein